VRDQPQAGKDRPRTLALRPGLQHARPRQHRQRRCGRVREHREVGEQALALAILGHIEDALLDRLGGRVDPSPLPFDGQLDHIARAGPAGSDDRARQAGASGADEARQPQDLAAAQRERG
jgi:hypothetical protein